MKTNKKDLAQMTDGEKLKELEKSPEWAKIKKSLDEEVSKSAKMGFDVGKHWQDMMAYLEKDKKEHPEDYK